MLHAQGLRERREGAISILSICSPPFQDPLSLPPSLSLIHFLSLSLAPISGSRNFPRKITTKISLSERAYSSSVPR